MPPITIIQGAQWGSEAKGTVAGALAIRDNYDYAVRTGAINAGHTVYYKGKPYAMQQLPVAWVNPHTRLVIGPGAYVHLPTLEREVAMVAEATGTTVEDVASRIYIDHRAALHLDTYAAEASEAGRHALIGATGKGCAEAIIHKIKDRARLDLIMSKVVPESSGWWYHDTPALLTDAYDQGARIMLEGTQGELLDFHTGPWPYVTSRQTIAAAWVAEAGLSPALHYEVVLVARTYPIRVAGNSGPMPYETTWENLARRIRRQLYTVGLGENHPLWVSEEAVLAWEAAVDEIGMRAGVPDLRHHCSFSSEQREARRDLLSTYSSQALELVPERLRPELFKLFEKTTVTKKIRRVAEFDQRQFDRTLNLVRPAWVALTFLNYEFPELHGKRNIGEAARRFIDNLDSRVRMVGTGPLPEHCLWR